MDLLIIVLNLWLIAACVLIFFVINVYCGVCIISIQMLLLRTSPLQTEPCLRNTKIVSVKMYVRSVITDSIKISKRQASFAGRYLILMYNMKKFLQAVSEESHQTTAGMLDAQD